MDLDRPPSQIAAAAAEEIHALTIRTQKPDVFTNPADVSATAHGIAAVIQRLPQTLAQLEAALMALDDDNRIRLADRHPREVSQNDIADAVSTVLSGLRETREGLQRVEPYLRSATGVLNSLGAPWPDPDEDEAS